MTGSIASVKGFPGFSVYAASKAALHAFARGWLNELKDRKIRVNVLSPGQIATPIQEQLFDAETMRKFESLIRVKDGPPGGDCDGGAVSGFRRFELRKWGGTGR